MILYVLKAGLVFVARLDSLFYAFPLVVGFGKGPNNERSGPHNFSKAPFSSKTAPVAESINTHNANPAIETRQEYT